MTRSFRSVCLVFEHERQIGAAFAFPTRSSHSCVFFPKRLGSAARIPREPLAHVPQAHLINRRFLRAHLACAHTRLFPRPPPGPAISE